MKKLNLYFIGLLLLLLKTSPISENTYYVSPTGKAENSGTQDSPWSLEKANQSLLPGDTAILLDGTYTVTPINPDNSGEEAAYITYRADAKQMAVFQDINGVHTGDRDSNGPAAVFVDDRSYVEIDGIKVLNVKRWVVGLHSNHITVKNSYFNGGTGWINCRLGQIGDGMKIQNNYFQGGTDLVSLDGGSGHLIEGNFFGDASHSGLVLLGVKNSVVRNNMLTNRLWRCMEVESSRFEPYRHSEYNLIENNYFGYSPIKILQYAGNNSIIRRNIFSRANEGMSWANYLGSAKTPEAWHDEHNRFYNNTIAECGTNEIVLDSINENKTKGIVPSDNTSTDGYGMTYSTNLFNPPVEGYSDVAYGDNICVNNIFYKNANTVQTKSSETTQVAFIWNADPEFGRFFNNNLYSGTKGADVFYFVDAVYQKPQVPRNSSINVFQQTYPNWAIGNFEADPLFVYPDKSDYRLREGSPCIDAGIALTKTASYGQGTEIAVEDALYFTNGYGVVAPDTIYVDSMRVTIVNVDYGTNTITVDKNISWNKGDGVFADYKGSAPDVGAYEYDTTQIVGVNDPGKSKTDESFYLFQNYPNPFNPSTIIEYELPVSGNVDLTVFDILGRKVNELFNGYKRAGNYKITWNARDNNGRQLTSGVYFLRIKAKNNIKTIKMMYLR